MRCPLVGGEVDAVGGEVGVEMVDCGRADDRGGDGGMARDERDRQLRL
jgi:hypothetical protein